jgi:hypothetical protein
MDLAAFFCTVRDCNTTQEERELRSKLGRSFDQDVPTFFDQWLAIISPDSTQPEPLVRFALYMLTIALRALELPFFTTFPPNWFERLVDDQPIRLGDYLLDAILRDHHDISAQAGRCVPLFVAAAGEASAPFFTRFLACLTQTELPDPLRLRLLCSLRSIYQSGSIVKVPRPSQIEILKDHVILFYGVLSDQAPDYMPFLGTVLGCLRALIPIAPAEFAVADEQVHLFTVLKPFAAHEMLYDDICSLLITIVDTYYDAHLFRLDAFLPLACLGIESANAGLAAASMRFWTKVCRLEIAKEEDNQFIRFCLSRMPPDRPADKSHDQPSGQPSDEPPEEPSDESLDERPDEIRHHPSDHLDPAPELHWCESRIRWLSRAFAQDHAQSVVNALFEGDDILSAAADCLLCHLMHSSPAEVFAAVQTRFVPSLVLLRPHLVCLSALCTPRHTFLEVNEFLALHQNAVIACLESSDDGMCISALSAIAAAVECYTLYLTAEHLPVLMSHFLGTDLVPSILTRVDETVQYAAVSCLRTILASSGISAALYPIDVMFDHLQQLWDLITRTVSATEVINCAYEIFNDFAKVERPLEMIDGLLVHSWETFLALPVETDGVRKANPVIRANCLGLISGIFKAHPGQLPGAAGAVLDMLLSNADHLSPLDECLHVIRSAFEHLDDMACFETVFALLVSVVGHTNVVELEPVFETLSVLCIRYPGEMAQRIPAHLELLEPLLHPEAFARASDGPFLRALAGFLSVAPVDFPPVYRDGLLEICTAACEIAFNDSRSDHDEAQDEPVEYEPEVMDALFESIILGFATLVFIDRGDCEFLEVRVPQWTITAEQLVLRYRRAAPARLLAAYFTLLETSRKHFPPSQQLIGELSLLPLAWGICSEDMDLWARASALWIRFHGWYTAHS